MSILIDFQHLDEFGWVRVKGAVPGERHCSAIPSGQFLSLRSWVLAARLLQFACSASGVEGKGLRRQGARDTLGGPFPDRRVHVPTGLAAHATVVCIGHQSLLRLRVVSGYHRSLRVLLTVVGGSIGVNSAHAIYWIITQSNSAICETDGALPRVVSATRCEAKG
jgi:hypothetical protein